MLARRRSRVRTRRMRLRRVLLAPLLALLLPLLADLLARLRALLRRPLPPALEVALRDGALLGREAVHALDRRRLAEGDLQRAAREQRGGGEDEGHPAHQHGHFTPPWAGGAGVAAAGDSSIRRSS